MNIQNTDQLDQLLSEPTPLVIEAIAKCPGDWIVLGAGGKMGPSLTRMLRRACDQAALDVDVIAVSRFSQPGLRDKLQQWNIQTIPCDLLEADQLDNLPDAQNIIYMPALKFGAEQQRGLTWAVNSYLPGLVGRKYAGKRILAFSTGNVYGLTPVPDGGSTESDTPSPEGEYAMSCLGRERIFEYAAERFECMVTIIRLNYACELRYGVLVDIARQVWTGQPIDLTMGHFNTIWQGDANAMSLAGISHVASPPFVINITGPETLSVRDAAQRFGQLLGKPVELTGNESPQALLSNPGRATEMYGPPSINIEQMTQWIADWIRADGPTLDKPTHFQVRDGRF